MASHSCRSVIGIRTMLVRAAAVATALACCAPPLHAAQDIELRRHLPERSGSTAPGTGVQRDILERARTQPSAMHKTQNDRDFQHVALLEDDGSLLEFVESGLFATRTQAIIQRFYASHADDFDALVIFSSADFAGDINPESGFAFELNMANDIDGIGLPRFNEGSTFVPGLQRLRSVINMNDLGEYDEDPDARLTSFLDGTSGMGILAQEYLHSVGAFVNADNVDILGRGGTHWSFFFHSQGSALEGNDWHDNGDGTFTSLQPATGFGQLDLYLLGLLGPQQLTEPMFAITSPVPDLLDLSGDSTLPVAGVTISGTRTPVTLQNIVSLHGERVPSVDASPKEFRLAFILIVPAGLTLSEFDLEKIDEFRMQWESWFTRETHGVGIVHTELGTVPVTVDFESDVIAAAPGTTVHFDNDSFGSIRSQTWHFGDGSTSSERHPQHSYATQGSYTVRLEVVGEGEVQQVERTAAVRIGPLHSWFEDSFETDLGWTDDPLDNAVSGRFIRSFPIGSWLRATVGNDLIEVAVQPDHDHTPGGNLCYVTGLAAPDAAIGVADVDDGITSLVSPRIDLSQAEDPVLEWWSWYVNNAGASPGRDVFTVDVSEDDGQSWVRARTFRSTFDYWRQSQLRLLDFIGLTDAVRLRFQFSDLSFPSVIEGAIDDVRIFDVDTVTPVQISALQARSSDAGVLLQWSLQEEAARSVLAIEVQRSRDVAGPYETIAHLPDTARSFEDAASGQDAASWYRLVLMTSQGSVVGAAVAVERRSPETDHLESLAEQDDGSVQVRFSLARDAEVSLSVYDVRGRRLLQRFLGHQPAGEHLQRWDRRDARGIPAPRGMVLVTLEVAGRVSSSKLMLRH